MSRPDSMKQIEQRIAVAPAGTAFITSDFLDLAEIPAINKALSRLTESKTIRRVIRGVYDRPQFSELLQEYAAPDMTQTAKAIARNFGWSVVPCGDTALNLLGLSTQVPAVWQYVSDGPYREYTIGNRALKFKHSANRDVSGLSEKSALIVQALKAQERVLTTENLYESAEMTSAAPSLQRDLSSLNHILEEPVTVTYDLPGDRTEVLDMTVMRGWLRHNDALGGFTYDEELWEESLREYVAGLAEEVDTVGTDFTFRMTGGGEFTETSYNYGWQIDQRAEIAQLEEDLSSGRDVEREPVYAVRAYVDEGIGDTYIEVDLSRQHLWVYEDGHVVKQSDVMSGRLTPQRFTPAGVYRVYFIQRNRTLRGEIQPDGQPEYMTPVSYWMEFRRTFGLHDNYWRNQSMFGDTYYIYGGSHGCINLPVAFAAELYPWVEEHGEVPVLVYYSQGDPF